MTPASVPPREPPAIPLVEIACELALVLVLWAVFPVEGAILPALLATWAGMILGLLFWHPYRVLGFVAPGLTVAFLTVVATFIWNWCPISAAIAGGSLGLSLGSLIHYRIRGRFTRLHPGWRIAALVICGAVAFAPIVSGADKVELAGWYSIAAAVALGPAAILAWLTLFRPAFSISVEAVLWHMYAIRGTGPGLSKLPRHGPCLIVANHACWFDPLFLEKVVPRKTIPMMTAKFYDVRIIRRLMVMFGVIRVPEKPMKQDTPEIDQAIAALDRGECVVIFPEGYLRRSEEKPLKRFGRGIWQILKARPGTPVFTCWVEGAWGSYTSYRGGLPTKNKKRDFRRPIRIAVPPAVTLPADVMDNHLQTRVFLMNEVLAARKLLGLDELPRFELPERDEEEAGA